MDATQRRMDFRTKEFSGLDTLDGCIHVYLIWSECELVQSMTILGKRW
jgi:hypothetical protein